MTLSEARTLRLGSFVKLNDGRNGLISGYMLDHDHAFSVTFYDGHSERIHYLALTVVPAYPVTAHSPTWTPTGWK